MPARPRSAAQASMESPRIAAIYESRMWRRNALIALLQGIRFEDEYALVEAALEVREDSRVLDLGCGPGIYSRPLARLASRGSVVGADLSEAMLRQASRHLREEAVENVSFVRADALALPLASQSFDAANCCGALHLFPDTQAALREIQRVLEPGGRLAIAAYRRRPGAMAERFAELRFRKTGMHAFRPEALASQLETAGFTRVQCLHERGVWLVMSALRP